MKRELVVPWSIAPMYSGIGGSSGFVERVGTLLDHVGVGLGASCDEHVADTEVVDERADKRTGERPDDRYPHVAVDVAVVAGNRDALETRDPRPQARPEVSGGVDR